jgi:hypothetical protein
MVRINVTVRPTTKRVTTLRTSTHQWVQQTHRGYQAWIFVPKGEDRPAERFACGDFHQKAKAAQACGLKVARAVAKQHDDLEAPTPQVQRRY